VGYWVKHKSKVGVYALSDLIFHLISVADSWNLNASGNLRFPSYFLLNLFKIAPGSTGYNLAITPRPTPSRAMVLEMF